jgi:hypothetical protein
VFNLLRQALTKQIAWCDEVPYYTNSEGKPNFERGPISRSDPVSFVPISCGKSTDVKVLIDLCKLNLLCRINGDRIEISGPFVEKQWFACALQVSIGLIEIMADYDSTFFTSHNAASIVSVLHTFMSADSYLDYIKIAKYGTTWMHARSLRQAELPKPPDNWVGGPPLLFSGSVKRFLANRIISGYRPKNQKLFWSIAQDKRCALQVPEAFVQKELETHRETMLKPSEEPHPEFIDQFKDKLEIVVQSMFQNTNLVQSFFGKSGRVASTFEYSNSACYEYSRTGGGVKAFLMKKALKDGVTGDDDLLQMDFDPYNGVMERRGYSTQDYLYLMNDTIDKVSLEQFGQYIYTSFPQCKAKVYSVLEPYKVRNITASNAVQYTLAHGMQKFMHSALKQYRQFSLMGEPLEDFENIDPESATEHVAWLLRGARPFEWIASGDFKAATDNIKIQLTKIVFERILNECCWKYGMDARLVHILRNVLYEHEINYPEWSGLPPAQQMNGQLMGSTLSFPILCIVNLITYWIAVRPFEHKMTELNVLVNGDDIMFTATKLRYDHWIETLKQTGLSPSQGKNFFHRDYCTVNSCLFRRVYKHEEYEKSLKKLRRISYIPFYNIGLIMGQSKVAKVEELGDCKKPVHCLHDKAVNGANNRIRADERFCYYNRTKLMSSSRLFDGFQLNWYLPRSMGGLGMKLPYGVEFCTQQAAYFGERSKGTVYKVLTDRQRVLAHGLRKSWYQEDMTKAPFKPIGMETDVDAQRWGCDITKHRFVSAQLSMCPMLPHHEEIPADKHPANWCPSTIDHTNVVWQYTFKGLDYRRFREELKAVDVHDKNIRLEPSNKGNSQKYFRMIEMGNPHLYDELKLFKLRKSRIGLNLPSIVEELMEDLDDQNSDTRSEMRECGMCSHNPCQCSDNF